MTRSDTRTIEQTLRIAASPRQVWEALATGEGIMRWFAPKARVTPGVGGGIWMSWGGEFEGENKIDVWEPDKHLRTTWTGYTPVAAGGAPVTLYVDFYLQGERGGTTLRLVHSGFGADADWDNEYNCVNHGWMFELRCLRHYIERHYGKERDSVWITRTYPMPAAALWAKVLGPGALTLEPAMTSLKEGDAFTLREPDGQTHRGKTLVSIPNVQFCGTDESCGDGVVRIETNPLGGVDSKNTSVWLWNAAWGDGRAALGGREERWSAMLDRLFGAA